MRPAICAVIIIASGLLGCSDPAGPVRPARATNAAPLLQDAPPGAAVSQAPAVRVTSSTGRPVEGVAVTFTVQSGDGALMETAPLTDVNGHASVGSWTLGSQPGLQVVTATFTALPHVTIVFEAVALPEGCSQLVMLDHALGGFQRLKDAGSAVYPCMLFDADRAAGHEYVVLLENMPVSGAYDAALFAAANTPAAPAISFTFSGHRLTGPLAAATAPGTAAPVTEALRAEAHEDAHAWDFGAGRIREHHPEPVSPALAQPVLLRADGGRVDLSSSAANPMVGDTLEVLMEALPHLGIARGNQRAVIRHVSPYLVIAEDVRLLTTLVRQSGSFNTPLSLQDLNAIATEYNVGRVQGDLLFQNRHNTAVEAGTPPRVVAVHSLMPGDSIWGYTYSVSNYFVWDFWVATDGSTRGLNQHPQRVTDNLFMHEISHMRHWGMLQRAALPPRGNRWLVEGFARFSERLPIAARLLGTNTPSRTANVLLPVNPAFNNAYFMDDVPSYASASGNMFFGYQNSAFVFDYFADQVARRGGNWLAAVREFLVAAGSPETLDAVVNRWLPGTTFSELFTRARIALYTDDIGTSGLPDWTQYHQYRLRESRPAASPALAAQDPRVLWPRVKPTEPTSVERTVDIGGAIGFVVDGAGSSGRTLYRLSAPLALNAVVSVARVR